MIFCYHVCLADRYLNSSASDSFCVPSSAIAIFHFASSFVSSPQFYKHCLHRIITDVRFVREQPSKHVLQIALSAFGRINVWQFLQYFLFSHILAFPLQSTSFPVHSSRKQVCSDPPSYGFYRLNMSLFYVLSSFSILFILYILVFSEVFIPFFGFSIFVVLYDGFSSFSELLDEPLLEACKSSSSVSFSSSSYS